MKTPTVAAVTSCMFSYCVFLNTPEAAAFSQIKIPPSAAIPKSILKASRDNNEADCSCGSCRTGATRSHDLADRRETHAEGCDYPDYSLANQQVAHAPGCNCPDCSQIHDPACPCTACSRARHGVGCNCSDCKL